MSSFRNPLFSLFKNAEYANHITLFPAPQLRLLIVHLPVLVMPSNVTSTCSSGAQGSASVNDAEKAEDQTASEKLDIEHVHVDDDPRKLSNMRKAVPFQ